MPSGQKSGPQAEVVETVRVVSDFVRTSLDAEYARRDRLDQRAASLVSTTGALVTLVGAVGALAPRSADFRLPLSAVVLLIAALVLFVVGIVLSQWTQLPTVGRGLAMSALRDLLGSEDIEDEAAILRRKAMVDIGTVEDLRYANARKMRFLSWATIAQMLAVSVLTGAVVVTLLLAATS